MKTAVLTSDTRHPEDGVVGYEGSDATGFFPADNAIFWIGDAGISASLDDMLAYERWIDANRDDEHGLYRRVSVQPTYADGTPATYGYGLARHEIAGLEFIGHAGALRGFRAQRLNARDARLSVVVIFNHECDTYGAAKSLIEAALGHAKPEPAPIPEGWDGQWLADDGLLVRIECGRRSATLAYATGGETVTLSPEGTLSAPGAILTRQGEALRMTRPRDNTAPKLTPLPPVETGDVTDIAGRYASAELEADLVIEARDGAAFARFEGLLGMGRMERMEPAGKDVWVVATRRSMDAPAPGDWTAIIRRDAAGRVEGLTLGCWLARGVAYARCA
jgi:D-aminopeptidase